MIFLQFDFKLISKDNFKCYNRRGRFFLSDKYRQFENKVALFAKSQYKGKLLSGDLSVSINAYFTSRKHSDIGNLPKSVLDALSGIIWIDDRQIKRLVIEIIENSEKDYFKITVIELS